MTNISRGPSQKVKRRKEKLVATQVQMKDSPWKRTDTAESRE